MNVIEYLGLRDIWHTFFIAPDTIRRALKYGSEKDFFDLMQVCDDDPGNFFQKRWRLRTRNAVEKAYEKFEALEEYRAGLTTCEDCGEEFHENESEEGYYNQYEAGHDEYFCPHCGSAV